jgi:hypothetical protein
MKDPDIQDDTSTDAEAFEVELLAQDRNVASAATGDVE